jgi:hypothetical protein
MSLGQEALHLLERAAELFNAGFGTPVPVSSNTRATERPPGGCTRATLYHHVSPTGELRSTGKRPVIR